MKHPTYYDLIYLMDTRNISFQTLANSLKLSFNEIVDKIIGKDDFTLSEGQQIAILLGESLDVIFFTPLCVDKDTKETHRESPLPEPPEPTMLCVTFSSIEEVVR